MAIVKLKDPRTNRVGIDTRPARAHRARIQAVAEAVPSEEIELEPAGHPLPITWSAVPGCTAARLAAASIDIAAAAVECPIDIRTSMDGNGRMIDPGEARRMIKIVLKKPVAIINGDQSVALNSSADLQNAGLRLVVACDLGDQRLMPCYCHPDLSPRGVYPPALQSMTFDAGVLAFGPVSTPKLRLSLVSGDAPEAFSELQLDLEDLTVSGLVGPVDCAVKTAGGTTVWSHPGELPLGNAVYTINLGQQLEAELNAALKAGTALSTSATITGECGMVRLWKKGFTGELKRSVSGITRVAVWGEPIALPCFDSLPAEQPSKVVGDLAVQYAGIRLCDEPRDNVPAGPSVSGTIVGSEPVDCVLTTIMIGSLPLARIALIGRAPVACELAVSVVEVVNGAAARCLTKERTLSVAVSEAFGMHWIDLDKIEYEVAQIGLRIRAVQGRFFWVRTADRQALRVAVWDPAPPETALTLGGHELIACDAAPVNLRGASFPAAAFTNRAPLLESSLFLTVDLSDLELRYAR